VNDMSLLPVVERHLRAHSVPPSRFGRLVAGDPRFVFDLRRGREPRAATRERVLAHIARTESHIRTINSRREGPHATAL
jgi:hypothetical protein